MSTNDFLKNENISVLWDVIIDEEIIKTHSKDSINKTEQIFYNNIKGFYESEKNKNLTLIDMNKKYIMLILEYMKTNLKPLNKIKIYDSENENTNQVEKSLITYEEIQNDKRSQFDNDLTKIQQEFTNAMALPVPEIPNFSDKIDEPLTEIELEIKKITEQRNYDIDQINKNLLQNQNQNTNWLKSEETSIKNEKLKKPNHLTIQIDNLNVSKKQISWADERTDERNNERNNERTDENIQLNMNEEINIENNIFKKLKKINTSNQVNTDYKISNNLNLENRIENLENGVKEILNSIKIMNDNMNKLINNK
jgi:hypothetical protein